MQMDKDKDQLLSETCIPCSQLHAACEELEILESLWTKHVSQAEQENSFWAGKYYELPKDQRIAHKEIESVKWVCTPDNKVVEYFTNLSKEADICKLCDIRLSKFVSNFCHLFD